MNVPKGKQRELIPAKSYLGVLIGLYDIGHHDGNYGPYHQVVFSYELHNLKTGKPLADKEGRPLILSDFIDVVLTKKGQPSPLAQHVRALTGKLPTDSFQLTTNLLERTATLTVVHVEKKGITRDSIGSVSGIDPEDVCQAEGDAVFYEIARDPKSKAPIPAATSSAIPAGVPEWVAKQIKSSMEFTALSEGGFADDEADEADEADDDEPEPEPARPAKREKVAASVASDDDDDEHPGL